MTIKKQAVMALFALLAATLVGCATAETKARAYRNAAEKFANPEKLKICYTREGGNTRGAEYRCFGQGCELPGCQDEVKE